MIETHLTPFFGDRWISSIDKAAADDYKAHRLAEGVSNSTVNRERAVLGRIMTLAFDWGRLRDLPLQRMAKLEEPPALDRFLTHEEADKLIDKAPRHLKPFIVTALETGGRRSEVLDLKWEDVDLPGGRIWFRKTKSGKSRSVPITPVLGSVLRSLLKVRPAREDLRDWVFTHRGRKMEDVRTAWAVTIEGAELGEDVTVHTLRHTFASWFIISGGDLYRLQNLLGHHSLKQTERYTHLSQEYMQSAVSRMGRGSQRRSQNVVGFSGAPAAATA